MFVFQGLIKETSRSHSDSPHSIGGLLRTIDQPDAGTSQQISMTLSGVEPAITASERSHTHALDSAAAGFRHLIACVNVNVKKKLCFFVSSKANTNASNEIIG
jgi:hypothetical protein